MPKGKYIVSASTIYRICISKYIAPSGARHIAGETRKKQMDDMRPKGARYIALGDTIYPLADTICRLNRRDMFAFGERVRRCAALSVYSSPS